MSSHTIHVIGFAVVKQEGNTTTERLFYAMNRVEMEQQRRKASKDGLTIDRWVSQTATGTRILGGRESVGEANAPRVKLIDCDVCDTHGCIVCNHSGITTKDNKNQWQDWQLKSIRRGALEQAAVAGVWIRNSDNQRIEVSCVPHPLNAWYKDAAGEDVIITKEELERDYHREQKAA